MQLFNFETILAIIILLFSAMTFNSTLKRRKKLGEKVIETLGGLKHSDFFVQFILIAMVGALTFTSWLYRGTSDNDYTLFYIVFPPALLIFIANALLLALAPKGFFKNGVSTCSGVLFYNEITMYTMSPQVRKKTIKVRFNSKGGFFGNGTYIEIEPSQEAEIKAYLKKHASFKKSNSSAPAPKKKK